MKFNFGANLKRLRLAKNYTQEQAAEKDLVLKAEQVCHVILAIVIDRLHIGAIKIVGCDQ